MNAVVAIQQQPGRSLTAADVRQHVNLIQEVMAAVMKKDTHYGVIPGCKQPSLYKAGSEVLLTTFRIAVSLKIEDLSTDDSVRYRVTVVGTHQQSGIIVGEGIGECSSDETKYKWRRCYVKQEFEHTPENMRRIKYSQPKGSAKVYEDMEVRTDPADVANTVLKMAKKRAQIDLTLTATAASDIFTQDVEDMPEELREHDDKTSVQQQRKVDSQPHGPYPEADFDRNLSSWRAVIAGGRKTADEIIAMVESKGTLTAEQKDAIRAPAAEAAAETPNEPIEGEIVTREESK